MRRWNEDDTDDEALPDELEEYDEKRRMHLHLRQKSATMDANDVRKRLSQTSMDDLFGELYKHESREESVSRSVTGDADESVEDVSNQGQFLKV